VCLLKQVVGLSLQLFRVFRIGGVDPLRHQRSEHALCHQLSDLERFPPPDLGEHDDRLEVFIKDAAGGLVQVAHARNTDPPHGGDEQQDRTKAGEEFRGNGKAPAYRGNAHVLY
jgi:hypothetical protein